MHHEFCGSNGFAHFAALFIDPRAELSTVQGHNFFNYDHRYMVCLLLPSVLDCVFGIFGMRVRARRLRGAACFDNRFE